MKKLNEKMQILTSGLMAIALMGSAFIYWKDREVRDEVQTQQILAVKEQVSDFKIWVEKRLDRIEKKLDDK